MLVAHLEDQFQRELDFPVGSRRRIKSPCAANRRTVLIEKRVVGQRGVKVGMVEHIEKLGAELQIQVLLDFGVFEQRKIEVHQAGSVDLIATPSPEKIRAG